jgi:hypothetical protein
MKSLQKIGALVASAGVAVLLALPQVASAQSNRTWVSGVGDDVNPCSRTAPCKTFAGAISKTATNGGINCIDPGPFGSVTITKSIVIDCRFALASVLVSGSNGITINAPDGHVVLRNIDIDGIATPGTGFAGIKIQAAASVHVEDVTIRAMGGSGIEFAPSVAPSSGPSELTLVRVFSRLNLQHGMLVAPTAGTAYVAVFESAFSGNVLTGTRVNDNSFASITDTIFSSNGTHGVAAVSAGGSAKVSLDRVTSSTNLNGGLLANGAGAVFNLSGVVTSGNAYGLYPPIGGGQYVSYGSNRTSGNLIGDGSPTSTQSQY